MINKIKSMRSVKQLAEIIFVATHRINHLNDLQIGRICKRLLNNKNKKIRLISEACLHSITGIKPKTAEVLQGPLAHRQRAYDLAKCRTELPKKLSKDVRYIITHFDWRNYVFQHTHYDECDNGSFRRRS